jgi:uridine phosphorylase
LIDDIGHLNYLTVMSSIISETDLILNPDGSVYHLHLLPEDIAQTIILVGDPERVPMVSAHFDKIDIIKSKREFITHTGTIGNKRLSVISTGIGTDNIDIVLNELDALVNIDLVNRVEKNTLTKLQLIRIGTSGALHEDIPVDSVLISSHGFGLDGLMNFYDYEPDASMEELLDQIDEQLGIYGMHPYLFKAPGGLFDKFIPHFKSGITASCNGFYGPQGRSVRATAMYDDLLQRMTELSLADDLRITNFEMETSGIYGLANILGHEAISVNAIIANRSKNTFSKQATETVESAIKQSIEVIIS